MSGGYWAPAGDGLDIIREELRAIYDRLSELEAPTASQMNQNLNHITEQAVLPLEVFRVDNAPAIGASFGSEFATVTTPTPVGFTRALVSITATARVRSNDTAGSWALLSLSPRIQGVPQITNWGSISGQMYGTAAASCTEVLTGLTAGDNITVGALAAFPGTYTLPQVSVAGSILFLR